MSYDLACNVTRQNYLIFIPKQTWLLSPVECWVGSLLASNTSAHFTLSSSTIILSPGYTVQKKVLHHKDFVGRKLLLPIFSPFHRSPAHQPRGEGCVFPSATRYRFGQPCAIIHECKGCLHRLEKVPWDHSGVSERGEAIAFRYQFEKNKVFDVMIIVRWFMLPSTDSVLDSQRMWLPSEPF